MHGYFRIACGGASLLLTALPVAGQTMRCADGGGPEICVQFDNLENAPAEDFDFVFDFNDPNYPGVKLLKGDDGEDLYEWRVWSWDKNTHAPANMGSITNNTNDKNWDFHVTILQDDDDPGADDLKNVLLGSGQIGDHWSKVESGSITGDLPAGGTFVVHRYDDSGGYANFTIGGNVGCAAPTGRNISAQGRAKRRPGSLGLDTGSPEGAQQASWQTCFAPSGLVSQRVIVTQGVALG